MKETTRSRTVLRIMLLGIGVWLVAASFFLWKRNGQSKEENLWPTSFGSPLRIEARGSDRSWRFSYFGPDGILGTNDDLQSTANLRLPVGVEVILSLRSDDFVYVFTCPALNLKEIAVPDLEFSISFRADRLGEFDLLMDPMCGFRLPPGKTMGIVSVDSESDFRRWLQEYIDRSSSPNK
jgi:heme/copper-type cytochrome/quinol oxidase subunit 2